MAFGDLTGVTAGKRLGVAFDRARLAEEIASEQDSNIEVGDFLSDLATAIKFRVKAGLSQGDWIEEPERIFSDGLIFATQEAVASDVKLQITLSLDASTSMWANKLMKHAGPAFLAFDRVIRKAVQDLPAGTIHYAPFIFHGTAHRLPAAYLNSYVGRAEKADGEEMKDSIWPIYPKEEQVQAAREAGEITPENGSRDFRLSGEDTRVASLFRAIQAWENVESDPQAVRLDIVLTDGVLQEDGDVEEATKIQEERNGKLRTVLLNFLPLDQWSEFQLPDRCAQFAVEPDNLNKSIRDILNESVADLFA